jgi:hypothetical protein
VRIKSRLIGGFTKIKELIHNIFVLRGSLRETRRERIDRRVPPDPRQEENPSPKSTQAEEEQEFFDLVGKEHVNRRPKTAEDVRSIIERIKARTKASQTHPSSDAQGELRFTLRCGL